MASDKEERAMIARVLLKSSCIRVRKKKGKLTLFLPESVRDIIATHLKLDVDDFQVGDGEQISLHDLAFAMDRQASHECAIGMVCEHLRAAKEAIEFEFETWLEVKKDKVRRQWYDKYNKWPTESAIMGSLIRQHGKQYKTKKAEVLTISANYRIMNNAIRTAMVVRGDMMRSMRPLLQNNDGSGIVVQAPLKVAKAKQISVTT